MKRVRCCIYTTTNQTGDTCQAITNTDACHRPLRRTTTHHHHPERSTTYFCYNTALPSCTETVVQSWGWTPPFGGGIYCQQRQCLTQTITCIRTIFPAVVISKQCCCYCTTTVSERSKLTHAVLGFAFCSFQYFIDLERERRRIRYLLNTKRGWGLGELGGCLCLCRDLCVCTCCWISVYIVYWLKILT